MKKIIAIFLSMACLFLASGCNYFFVDKEQVIYTKTVNELIAALDDKDSDAIYNLFSNSVQKDCNDLRDKIDELISIYSGPTEKIGDISTLAGGASYEDGKVCKNAYTTFPVFANGKYYWIHLNLMYENTFDENQIGITQLDFRTGDAHYEFWSGEDKLKEKKGINIFDKNVDEYNIISINNYPYDYHPTETLNIEDVKSFFKTSTSLSAFVERFGQAASKDDFAFIYPLPKEDGEERYLYVFCMGDEIIFSDILSDFAYIDKVLKEQ